MDIGGFFANLFNSIFNPTPSAQTPTPDPVPTPLPVIPPVSAPNPVAVPVPTVLPSPTPVPVPSPATTPVELISIAALQLIIDSEGLDQPYLFPGGDSGITIGLGDDLGYQTVEEFKAKWASLLPSAWISDLSTAIGIHGSRAAAMASKFKGIRIKMDDATTVFKGYSLPEYYKLSLGAFPCLEKLCLHAKGAIVSLVYNRGASLEGSRRTEMAKIKSILDSAPDPADNDTYRAIAEQFRLMKRLWVGQGLDGLLARRDAEAALVERCIA